MRRRTITYLQARLLLLLLGLGLGSGLTVAAWYRGAAPLEVLAPLLYIPVFAGGIFLGVPGGLVAAAFATVVYGVLLLEQTRAVGTALFVGLFVNRAATYFLYGAIVALAATYLETRLRKLELYDQVDDLTELYNSAFFLEDTDLETSRSNRYQTLFSVAELSVGREAFAGQSGRRYRRTLRDLSGRVRAAVRRVDRAARIDDGSRDRILVVLPETGREGARIFTERLEVAARELLVARGCIVDGNVAARFVSYPDDAADLTALRADVSAVDERRRAIRS